MPRPKSQQPDDDKEALLVGQRISRNLEALMAVRGLNQKEFSDQTGLSTSTISNLLSGRKNPSFVTVVKAARGVKVDPLELAGFKPLQIPEAADTGPPVSTAKFVELVRTVREMGEQLQKLQAEHHTEQPGAHKRKRSS